MMRNTELFENENYSVLLLNKFVDNGIRESILKTIKCIQA